MSYKLGRFWPVWPVTILLLLLMVLMTVFTNAVDNRNKLLMLHITVTVFAAGAVLLIADRFKSDIAGNILPEVISRFPGCRPDDLHRSEMFVFLDI